MLNQKRDGAQCANPALGLLLKGSNESLVCFEAVQADYVAYTIVLLHPASQALTQNAAMLYACRMWVNRSKCG